MKGIFNYLKMSNALVHVNPHIEKLFDYVTLHFSSMNSYSLVYVLISLKWTSIWN